jgi:hypothetical protein
MSGVVFECAVLLVVLCCVVSLRKVAENLICAFVGESYGCLGPWSVVVCGVYRRWVNTGSVCSSSM